MAQPVDDPNHLPNMSVGQLWSLRDRAKCMSHGGTDNAEASALCETLALAVIMELRSRGQVA